MISFAILALIGGAVLHTKTEAVSGSDWRAGNIIDDSVFFNNSDMSTAQVQQFLSSKVPRL